MLTGIHFLLSYTCTYKCDHCFVYSSPEAEGTFTLRQVRAVLDEAKRIGSIESIYFEGGEPFLFYPLLVESVRLARGAGFQVGVVTNSYFATSEEDAELWLGPLAKLGIADLSLSDDAFHAADLQDNPAKRALRAAQRLDLPVGSICIEEPTVETVAEPAQGKGEPVVGGGVMFRGRAVEKLINEELPRRPWETFTECPHEELVHPARVHLDPYGHVHLCQGVSLGNAWETPLSQLVKDYDAAAHPICGPLIRGGPALLAKTYDVEHEAGYVDACHLCYLVRRSLLERFPQFLAPRQVYGLE
ncbi:MAG: radical SAM protein [Thermoflexales bacterium]|nr:radical SAM protein [Thermoflexales bacterium]